MLGYTGSAGQRFILLLALHPYFKVHALGASSRSAGKNYRDAVRWKQDIPMSKKLGEMVVKECRSEEFRDCELIFSGLDSDVAGEIGTSPVFTTISMYLKVLSTELEFSQANLAVFSNAKIPLKRPAGSTHRPHCQRFSPELDPTPKKTTRPWKRILGLQLELCSYWDSHPFCSYTSKFRPCRSGLCDDYASCIGCRIPWGQQYGYIGQCSPIHLWRGRQIGNRSIEDPWICAPGDDIFSKSV